MTDDAIFDLIAALELPLSVGDVRARLVAAKLSVRRKEESATDTGAAALIVSAARKRQPQS